MATQPTPNATELEKLVEAHLLLVKMSAELRKGPSSAPTPEGPAVVSIDGRKTA